MKKRFSLVIDQERCIGCEACSVACMLENNTNVPFIRVKTSNFRLENCMRLVKKIEKSMC